MRRWSAAWLLDLAGYPLHTPVARNNFSSPLRIHIVARGATNPRKNTDENGSSCAIKTSLRLWPPHPKVPCATQECTHAFKRPEGPFKLSRRSSSTSQTPRSPQAALLPDRGVSTACEEKGTVRAARYCVVQTRLVISSRCNTLFLLFLD